MTSFEVPNIIHFVFGFIPQTQPFAFVHYLAVYSAYRVNRPSSIYFHYHHESYGKWWERLKHDVPVLKERKIDIPTHFGEKEIIHTAHKADKARMDILFEMGGIYMDIDTISVRPYTHLLNYPTTLCKQYMLRYKHTQTGVYATPYIGGICNAIMLTKPKSSFFKIWMMFYEKAFKPDGWEEASIWLPLLLSKKYPDLVNVLEPPAFNVPCCWEAQKMFQNDVQEIPKDLISLHLCETMSQKYLKNIINWNWMHEHPDTLYGKLIKPFHVKCIISNNCYGSQYYKQKKITYITPFIGMFMYAKCYIHLLENFNEIMSIEPDISTTKPATHCVLRLSTVYLHFIHDTNTQECIHKWNRRRQRMYSKSECDVKMCDRDGFDESIAQRFAALKGFKSKTLFLSKSFQHITNLDSSVKIVYLDTEITPDGFQLECLHPITST